MPFQVCDGNQNCKNGADECHPSCIKSVFSDEKSMIKSKEILWFISGLGEKQLSKNINSSTKTGFLFRSVRPWWKYRGDHYGSSFPETPE